jgi:MFS family permease
MDSNESHSDTSVVSKRPKISFRLWMVYILVGLAGQFAWAIENMYLNSYITYLNFNAPSGQGFAYNTVIATTVALSAVVATLTTVFMGALSDKIGHRKWFIAIGYIIWGFATASFGLFNVDSSNSLIPVVMSAFSAACMVVVMDSVMTFFGSTANDAAFNSYVTSSTDDRNRSKVEGVLGILPLLSMLFIFVGLNGLTTKENGYRWDLFFYVIGAIVTVVGIASIFLIPKEGKFVKPTETYIRQLSYGFRPSTVKSNRNLYLVLGMYFFYSTACQVYFPYLMVYVERTCQISNAGTGITPFAIVMAIALLVGSVLSVFFGFLADKIGKDKMILPSMGTLGIGLLLMAFIPSIGDTMGRTVYGAISSLLMILGFVGIPTVINALVKQYIPKGKEGAFMGVRMVAVVALPMCIGPFIGSAFNSTYGAIFTGEYGVTDHLPSSFGYFMALGILALTLIPYFFYRKGKAQEQNVAAAK